MDGLDVAISANSSQRLSGYDHRTSPKTPKRRRWGKFVPFILVVILPTVMTATYFYGFASDQYVSEARFVVRGDTQQTPGGLSSLLQSAGVTHAQDDTFAVQDYILSRDALADLVKDNNIRTIFARPEADPLSRFPILWGGQSFEHLYKYYLKHVDVEMNTETGISELTVKSFRPNDSQYIAQALLLASERLVNRMNDRQRENKLRDSRKEVTLAEQRVQDVSNRIADFRNRQSLLDPNKQSVPMLQAIATLQGKLTSVKLELSQLQANSPLLASTRQRAAALEQQIANAKAEITGADSSLVPKIREFDELSLERDFAEKQLASATSSLESARINADRQELYLEEIVQPNTPDYASYPKRLSQVAVVFATLLGIYIGGALLIAGAREHKLV
jgi:capsular polysaccharide transport system permease protein